MRFKASDPRVIRAREGAAQALSVLHMTGDLDALDLMVIHGDLNVALDALRELEDEVARSEEERT